MTTGKIIFRIYNTNTEKNFIRLLKSMGFKEQDPQEIDPYDLDDNMIHMIRPIPK